MIERPILYSFRRCPYAIRARLALAMSGIGVDIHEVALRDKPPAMIAVSPKGTVPVLVLPNGTVIDQSIDIMRWAMARLELTGDDLALIEANDGVFKFHLDRYKYAARDGTDRAEHRSAATILLAVLDDRLGISPELAGAERSLVDLALVPFVRQFANTDRLYFDALDLPRLHRWLDRHLNSALFESVMRKYPTNGGGSVTDRTVADRVSC